MCCKEKCLIRCKSQHKNDAHAEAGELNHIPIRAAAALSQQDHEIYEWHEEFDAAVVFEKINNCDQ